MGVSTSDFDRAVRRSEDFVVLGLVDINGLFA